MSLLGFSKKLNIFALLILLWLIQQGLVFGGPTATLKGISSLESKEEHAVKKEEVIFSRPQLEYNSGNLRDPFEDLIQKRQHEEILASQKEIKPSSGRQEFTQVKRLPQVAVSGMIWGGTVPQAIINDKVVKVGDTIDDMRILSIDKNGIKVLFMNSEYTILSPAVKNIEVLKESKGGKNAK